MSTAGGYPNIEGWSDPASDPLGDLLAYCDALTPTGDTMTTKPDPGAVTAALAEFDAAEAVITAQAALNAAVEAHVDAALHERATWDDYLATGELVGQRSPEAWDTNRAAEERAGVLGDTATDAYHALVEARVEYIRATAGQRPPQETP